jgi:hypothetical protein
LLYEQFALNFILSKGIPERGLSNAIVSTFIAHETRPVEQKQPE